MYKQYIEGVNLSLEKGTDKVPDDNKYHIIKDNEIIFSHKSKKIAQDKFAELKPEIKQNKSQTTQKNLLKDEIADRCIGQHVSARISKNFKKGGKKKLR